MSIRTWGKRLLKGLLVVVLVPGTVLWLPGLMG